MKSKYHVALVGNPNTGKSSLFNHLCGSRQNVANYPGATIEKKSGIFMENQLTFEVLDLPGCYSLKAHSPEERITADTLAGKLPDSHKPDLVLLMADATNLRRNLYLATQVMEYRLPMILVLTMPDLAAKKQIRLNLPLLEQRLGIPVIPVITRDRADVLRFRRELAESVAKLKSPPLLPLPDRVKNKLQQGGYNFQQPNFNLFDSILGLPDAAQARYDIVSQWLEGVEIRPETDPDQTTKKIDAIVTHRFWGLILFAGIMSLIFQSIYFWAEPLMQLIEFVFGSMSEFLGKPLADYPTLQSLLVDGIINGVGSVMVFLPQIVFLFFFIAILEDTGYLARAAFLMDRLLGWTGLNGKAFVPMLSSFACAIPGVLSARTIAEPSARMTTILVSPLMSCSSRLPLYFVLISAFIKPKFGAAWAAFAFVAMHALGALIALPVAYILNHGLLKAKNSPFLLEMPAYRRPQWRNVYYKIKTAATKFITNAGSIILVFSVIIWFFTYFPRNEEIIKKIDSAILSVLPADLNEAERQAALERARKAALLEESYLGRLGKAIQPLFAPLGFDWKISVGILGAFPARELIISTLGIIYNVGDGNDETLQLSLVEKLPLEKYPDGRPVYTPMVAISLLIFFALSAQCMSTIAIVKKELNSWRWAGFLFVYMTALAYLLALVVYQTGRWLAA